MRLARMMNAEIVSCDSMQVYRGMDILTSKPLLGERARVKHHLLSFVPVSKEFNVTLYRAQAVRTIDRIIQKGKTPLLVGGTGLYLSVLLDGIFDVRAHDDKLRERLARQAEESGSAELHRILSRVDPVAASRIHPHDARRIIRALEVYQVTGERISELQKRRSGLSSTHRVRIAGLRMENSALRARIEKRAAAMIRRGAVGEVRRMLRWHPSKTARSALGVREIEGYLNGEYTLALAREKLAQATYQYARRQMTWFRKEKRIVWFDVAASDRPATLASRIYSFFMKS
jgi:tRNA dimethylallyltransferase